MSKRKSPSAPVNPDIRSQEKRMLVRKYRQTVLFNEREISMINRYCKKFNVNSKSALYRKIILTHILEQLDKSNPTLF